MCGGLVQFPSHIDGRVGIHGLVGELWFLFVLDESADCMNASIHVLEHVLKSFWLQAVSCLVFYILEGAHS